MSRLSVDLRPLRGSRDLRLLYGGRAISQLGSAITTVAAGLQVFDLTHSSLAVGALSVAEAVPMVSGMLAGGVLADRMDRRRLILSSQLFAGAFIVGLALNAASAHPRLWPLYVFAAASGAALGLGAPARTAATATLVPPTQLPAAAALNSTVNKTAALVGPLIGGLVVDRFGFATGFGADAFSFLIYVVVAWGMRPLPPAAQTTGTGRSSVAEAFSYVRRHTLVIGILLIDADAMVFGMPSAVFPALASDTFHGGATVVGLLYAAPAAGALIGAATSGWISAVRRAGLVLLGSVLLWGGAIAGFGLSRVLPVALLLLVVAGAADLVSEVLRSSLLQLSIPDTLRGRLTALWLAQANGAPAFGNLEAGAVATVSSPAISVISGGAACMLGALLLSRVLPALRQARLGATAERPATELAPAAGRHGRGGR